MRTIDQTIRAIEAGEAVPAAEIRIAVAVLHHAHLELAHGVERALAEVGTDRWPMARLGGYAYESDMMLRDPVIMYRPAGGMLTAFLASEKSSEAAS